MLRNLQLRLNIYFPLVSFLIYDYDIGFDSVHYKHKHKEYTYYDRAAMNLVNIRVKQAIVLERYTV